MPQVKTHLSLGPQFKHVLQFRDRPSGVFPSVHVFDRQSWCERDPARRPVDSIWMQNNRPGLGQFRKELYEVFFLVFLKCTRRVEGNVFVTIQVQVAERAEEWFNLRYPQCRKLDGFEIVSAKKSQGPREISQRNRPSRIANESH